MQKHTEIIAAVLLLCPGIRVCGSPVEVPPDSSVWFLKQTPPSPDAWWKADDSMRKVNEKAISQWMPPECAIHLMGWGLLHEPYRILTRTEDSYDGLAQKIMEALYRGGDDPHITNILHMALLAPTNHYREATFRACVMASPVPMTSLAETVVRRIPANAREQWYRRASEAAWRPSFWDRLFPPKEKPSRESLRLAHFLFTVKNVETGPACLKAIGDPADPKRDKAKP
jgi:hypothetical protein